jgi:hypothetical protein
MADRPHRVVVSGAAGAPASPTPPRPPRAASARRHPRLLLPLGGGRGSSFSRPARPGRYLQLDYPHGTGDARLGSRRTGAGRCARAVGGGVERAANASPHASSSGVYAWWSVSVRREGMFFRRERA